MARRISIASVFLAPALCWPSAGALAGGADFSQIERLQVTTETRFIVLYDDFFDRIGVDFDFKVDDAIGNLPPAIAPLNAPFSIEVGGGFQQPQLSPDLDIFFRRNVGGNDRVNESLSPRDETLTSGQVRANVGVGPNVRAFFELSQTTGDDATDGFNITFAPGDRVITDVIISPDTTTLRAGIEGDLFAVRLADSVWSAISAGVFTGVRFGETETRVIAQGPATSIATRRHSESTAAAILGGEITERIFFDMAPLYVFWRAGGELIFGDDITTSVTTAGAETTVTVDQGVTPNGYVTAGVGIPFYSDARLKTGIVRLATLDRGIGLYQYSYLGEDRRRVGVIAQEVAVAAPNAVTRDARGYLMVDYGALFSDPAMLGALERSGYRLAP